MEFPTNAAARLPEYCRDKLFRLIDGRNDKHGLLLPVIRDELAVAADFTTLNEELGRAELAEAGSRHRAMADEDLAKIKGAVEYARAKADAKKAERDRARARKNRASAGWKETDYVVATVDWLNTFDQLARSGHKFHFAHIPGVLPKLKASTSYADAVADIRAQIVDETVALKALNDVLDLPAALVERMDLEIDALAARGVPDFYLGHSPMPPFDLATRLSVGTLARFRCGSAIVRCRAGEAFCVLGKRSCQKCISAILSAGLKRPRSQAGVGYSG